MNLNFKFFDFILDRINLIYLSLIFFLAEALFLCSKGIGYLDILNLIGISTIVILSVFYFEYKKKKKYFNEIERSLNSLEQKYLIFHCLESPNTNEEKILFDILEIINKSISNELSLLQKEKIDYREYIEKWVHEVKTPIAAINLILDNNKSNVSFEIKNEIEEIYYYIEQALFYARSESLEKDYFVKELNINKIMNKVIIRNRKALILNNIDINIEGEEALIYSDEKWLEFIINQIIINSIKYRKDNPKIDIKIESFLNRVELSIKDNGIGIKESDIYRIFDKAFTGTNGRTEKSTGIGFYLVKKLCGKLSLLIEVESKYSVFTEFKIIFPKGSFSSNEMFLSDNIVTIK